MTAPPTITDLTEAPLTDRIVDRIESYLDATESFAASEVPLYCQEVLLQHALLHSTWAFGALLFTAFAFVLYRVLRKVAQDPDNDLTTDEGFACVAGRVVTVIIGALVFSFAFIPSIYEVLRTFFAPRVVLFEHLRGLL